MSELEAAITESLDSIPERQYNIKLALFLVNPRSFVSQLIAGRTGEPYTHAAVSIDGKWYHSSETVGKFTEFNPQEFSGRHAIVAETTATNVVSWLALMKGKKYDWRGIRQWAFGFAREREDDLYCFETGASLMNHIGIKCTPRRESKLFSGCDIFHAATEAGLAWVVKDISDV